MSNTTFDTPYGRNITYGLQQLAIDFDLSYLYGTVPQDYTLDQYVLTRNRSVGVMTLTVDHP